MKNRSSDYIDGLVDYYLMVIEVLCIIDGIVGCALGDCKIELKIVAGTQCGQKRGNRLGVTPLKGLI